MENLIYIAIPVINGEINGNPILLEVNEVFEYFDNNESIIIRLDIENKKIIEIVDNFSI